MMLRGTKIVFIVGVLIFLTRCAMRQVVDERRTVTKPVVETTPTLPMSVTKCDATRMKEKWDLWTKGSCLRGANLWQKRIEPDIDGDSFGTGPVGPPYTQADLDALAKLGANYVVISHPGLFTERPPYVWDEAAAKNLDELLARVAKANLFAVISFRTGPGRNEAGFDSSEKARALHTVWRDARAQAAWVEMWKKTAVRYAKVANVVGYNLLVEPNSNDVLLHISEPADFYAKYANTTYDWNPFAEKMAMAIRSVDSETPLLIGGMDYSHASWLSKVKLKGISRVVYLVHQYEPFEYTHQETSGPRSYPGSFDASGEGRAERVDRKWIEGQLSDALELKEEKHVPISINEFGAMRWVKGSARYLDDSMQVFEANGMNHAIWLWESSWHGVNYDQFNYRRGTDPSKHSDVPGNELLSVISKHWKENSVRPGQVKWARNGIGQRP